MTLYDKACLRTEQGRIMLFLADLELKSQEHENAARAFAAYAG